MTKANTAILHYSAPPVVGGVEGVMEAHARIFRQMGYPVTMIAGKGTAEALPAGVGLEILPLLDSQHEAILTAGDLLDKGEIPPNFRALKEAIIQELAPVIAQFDNLIVHNVFTKHFNLPLTAALFDLLDQGLIPNCIAWHHDFTWTSPRSRSKVHPGYPWDLLRRFRPDMRHVTISEERQEELAGLYHCDRDAIRVIYNGVDPQQMWGLGEACWQLVQRLDLLAADLILLMPVRVTKAKNIEFALDAAAALKAGGLKLKLLLTGPPDPHDPQSLAYFRSLQQRRDALGLVDEMHFVYESGSNKDMPYLIDLDVVAGLIRVADLMFMPSHQEGFGMPVLEAGLVGTAVAAAGAVPAADEIGRTDVLRFNLDDGPQSVARRLMDWAGEDKRLHLARRTRQKFTWQALFERGIKPLLVSREGT